MSGQIVSPQISIPFNNLLRKRDHTLDEFQTSQQGAHASAVCRPLSLVVYTTTSSVVYPSYPLVRLGVM